MLDVNLKAPEHYINRELSFLYFNQRVLAQAHDESLPLLERIRFLGISCSNLDEFFEIRVAGLKQRQELGSLTGGPDGMSVPEQLVAIHERAAALVTDQYELLNQLVFPALAGEGIQFVNAKTLTPAQRTWVGDYFAKEVEPVLTPLGLDPARPFPRIQNKSLNFIVRLSGKDAFGRDAELAVVQVPRSLPRIIRLPPTTGEPGKTYFVFLSAVISTFVQQLFSGMKVEGAWQFRVTRNSDLFVDDEEVDNLLRAIEGELAQRRYGAAVRLETSLDCPEDITNFLLRHFALKRDDLYQVNGPVNLNRLMAIYDLVDRPDLKYPSFTPCIPKRLVAKEDIFAVMREGEVLLHHPFEAFAPVIDFLRQAAADPDVLAIKQTLYRTGPQSPVVDQLVDAARAGKEVTVIIELMARFDEAANIKLATRLQEAGAHVMYGVVGYKTHAKLIMVVRRERGKLRRYCHCGTGNYHPSTARVYTDYGLFTCDEPVGEDLHELFLQLTSPTRVATMQKILQSPFTLHEGLLEKTRREMAFAREGKPARIIAKMNALIEPQIIQTLYSAAMAGVKIDLIVRGICALRPGLPGISENITVRSVIGRFLEHSRVYYFHNDGNPDIFCASADWMERNFFRRIEVCFPIERKQHRDRIVEDLETYLVDTEQAWVLKPDGQYVHATANGAPQVSAQQVLLQRYSDCNE
ncbi:polyphosphate kinase 1 [Steroidobacter sp.]|uniref:polyphosphate kinase 1 n=1 Tax=Steroidobacter sp. TaxID=1978227 RepID=UPI001A49EB44|nr:polyphosphate kinase 1 [Steroidobacter sp.]MBL8265746.1 polyphosphate kinase 1 [Steroidobacter sp.]